MLWNIKIVNLNQKQYHSYLEVNLSGEWFMSLSTLANILGFRSEPVSNLSLLWHMSNVSKYFANCILLLQILWEDRGQYSCIYASSHVIHSVLFWWLLKWILNCKMTSSTKMWKNALKHVPIGYDNNLEDGRLSWCCDF